MQPDTPYADLSFALSGEKLPLNHGYCLYSAIATHIPAIHGQPWLSIHNINGIPDKQGSIKLTEDSRLKLRLPVDKIPLVYPLAGRRLNLKENHIRLYTPQVLMLQPQPKLRSRSTEFSVKGRLKHVELSMETILPYAQRRRSQALYKGYGESSRMSGD